MKIFAGILALTLMTAAPALAQTAGGWHITGKFGSRDFALDCQFQPLAAKFGGVCVEVPPTDNPGKSHVLTKGSLAGNQISWTYKANYMFYKFDINFTGTLKGDNIAGRVDVQGHEGSFSGSRE